MKITKSLLPSLLMCVFLLAPAVNGVALAQSETSDVKVVEVPPALGPDSIKALVAKLDEKQTAALVELIGLLNTSATGGKAPEASEEPGAFDIIKSWFSTFSVSMEKNIRSFPRMVTELGSTLALIFQGREPGGNLKFLFLLALAIAAGLAAEWLVNRFSARRREQIRQARPAAVLDIFKVLMVRSGIEIGGVAVFAVVALIAANLLVRSEDDLFLISTFIVNVIVMVRIFSSISRLILAPRRPELRLVRTDTWTAQYIERNFILLAAVAGAGFFLAAVMQKSGVATIDSLRFWFGMVLHILIIVVLLTARRGLTQIIVGSEENLTPGLRRMASWWPGVSAGVVAFNWCFVQFVLSGGHQALSPQRSAIAIFLIILAPFLDTIVRGIAAELAPAGGGMGEVAEKARMETRLSYVRIGRVLLIGLLIFIVGKLWGVSLRNVTEAGLGAQVAANVVGFLLILAFGYLAWEISNLWISKRLSKEMPVASTDAEGAAEGGAEGGTGQSRMATILPIMRMTLQVTIIVITVLLALSQLGVNITPLLAGAGVLGLAIGFGAQTLVKDVVSGVFFLLDDAFRLGEFVAVGSTMGVVEKISIRSLQLRQDTGPVHIVPYGSISQLTNNSRDWVTMKLRFTVPYDTDLEKVRKIFKNIGQEMLAVPELAAVLINPFKSQGAADVTDVGIVVRGKFTTIPGGQFVIRKEAYTRVQKAFEANGIEFARKEVRVQMPENPNSADLTRDQKRIISAAASQASESTGKDA